MVPTYVGQGITYILLSKPYINTFVHSWQIGLGQITDWLKFSRAFKITSWLRENHFVLHIVGLP